jgi:hypothetical protein
MITASYFNYRRIEVQVPSNPVEGHLTLKLNEAYHLYKELERALAEAGYPDEAAGA